MKRVLIAGVTALLLGGCGVESQEPEAQEPLESTEQGIIYPCPWRYSYIRTWTTNGVETGYERCECDGTSTVYGTIGGRYTQTLLDSCG